MRLLRGGVKSSIAPGYGVGLSCDDNDNSKMGELTMGDDAYYACMQKDTCGKEASAFGLGTRVGRQTRGSNQPTRRTSGRPTAGYKTTIRNERNELTDGWNYEKVVVRSNLRVEVQMKSSHFIWAKYRETSEVIDLHGLFSEYWSSKNCEFTVLSQSIITNQSAQS